MRIGVISDTHDDIGNTRRAIEIFNEMDADYVFHAGDYVYPGIITLFEKLNKDIKFYGVRGNNDGELLGIIQQFSRLKDALFLNEFGRITIQGKKLGIYHGTNLPLSETLIESQLFDFLVFGHTHIKRIKKIGKTLVLNPGPLNRNFFSTPTDDGPYVIIHDEKKDKTEFININKP